VDKWTQPVFVPTAGPDKELSGQRENPIDHLEVSALLDPSPSPSSSSLAIELVATPAIGIAAFGQWKLPAITVRLPKSQPHNGRISYGIWIEGIVAS